MSEGKISLASAIATLLVTVSPACAGSSPSGNYRLTPPGTVIGRDADEIEERTFAVAGNPDIPAPGTIVGMDGNIHAPSDTPATATAPSAAIAQIRHNETAQPPVSAAAVPGKADASSDIGHRVAAFIANGNPYLIARYRYEFAEQQGLPNHAHSSTLRTRLGYRSANYRGFAGLLELEFVSLLGNDDYNDTVNRKAGFPVLADVRASEVNQAYGEYTGFSNTLLRYGRQVISLDNERFVGEAGFRQNNQTFDGATFTNASLPDTEIFYSHVYNANRVFGNDSPVGDFHGNIDLLNASNAALPIGVATGYAYFIDLVNAPTLSSRTFGANLKGKRHIGDDLNFRYYAEYARQAEMGNNPVDYDARYYNLSPAITAGGWAFTGGYEVLGSDHGRIGFSTPLATFHKFSWADQFTTTPANGLKNAYLDVAYQFKRGDSDPLNGFEARFQYHDYHADSGSAHYGSEFGFDFKYPALKHAYVEAQYADYNADRLGADNRKLSVDLGISY